MTKFSILFLIDHLFCHLVSPRSLGHIGVWNSYYELPEFNSVACNFMNFSGPIAWLMTYLPWVFVLQCSKFQIACKVRFVLSVVLGAELVFYWSGELSVKLVDRFCTPSPPLFFFFLFFFWLKSIVYIWTSVHKWRA